MKKISTKTGLTLVEIIIYMAILVLLTGAVINAVLGLSSTYQKLKVVKQVERSAVISMDRMTREIRNSTSVDVPNSALGTSPGILQLNSVTPGGTARVVKFSLIGQSGIIRVYENGVDQGPLTSQFASTTNLVFRLITTPKSQAVKIEMTLRASSTRYIETDNFYDTVVLRGSY